MKNYGLIILAGGKSSRMGKDKALVKIQNNTLTEIVYNNLKDFCSEVIISTNNPDVSVTGVKIVSDKYKNIGPAGGIFSALSVSRYERNIIISVDSPFVTKDVFEYLIKTDKKNTDVRIVSEKNLLHPLIGIYSKQFSDILLKEIKIGNYKIRDIIKKTSFEIIDVSSKDFYNKMLFQNINTEEDYITALKYVKGI